MSATGHGTHGTPLGDDATIVALAEETQTDHAVVQCLYQEEFAELEAQSSVKNFIGVIAARRVRERLTAAHTQDQPRSAPAAQKRSQAA